MQETASTRYLLVFTRICDRHIDLVVFSTLGNEGKLVMKGIQIRLQGGVSVPVLNIGV